MRKLATVRTVSEIRPIEGADMIELAIIDGWQCVAKKGELKQGAKALYCEIDSLLPANDPRFAFLAARGTSKNADGAEGYRLRSIKLRGQLSQGLALPVEMFPEIEDDDIDTALGIVKYEPPMPAQLMGLARGNFPSFIRKTDQERIQNLPHLLGDTGTWEVTQKLDGSSMTVYFNNGEFGVCSRNIDLKETDGNSFWNAARRLGLREKMATFGKNIALQGELIGEGIQKNPEQIAGQDFYLFDVWDIDRQCHVSMGERKIAAAALGLKSVPLIDIITLEIFDSMASILKCAEGFSWLNGKTQREGVVFKRIDGSDSFKVISNKYLLKNEQ